MKLDKITFSGVDCSTHLPTLQSLTAEYPIMELGILLSTSLAGKDRKYPDYDTIEKITNFIPKNHLSLHLCGRICKKIMETGYIDFPLLKKFNRVQLNFSYNDIPHVDFIRLKDILINQEIIIQLHGRNGTCIPLLKEYNANISGLIDSSKGTGVESKWKRSNFRGIKCGYAGGLGPGNLKRKLKELDLLLGKNTITWVDMETNIRDGSNWFSINKVSQCLKEAKHYI